MVSSEDQYSGSIGDGIDILIETYTDCCACEDGDHQVCL